MTISLKVVPMPLEGTAVVLDCSANTGAALRGQGEWNYTCGSCHKILLESITERQVLNVVLKCSCGAYNLSPTE